jgi:hypothetical protein
MDVINYRLRSDYRKKSFEKLLVNKSLWKIQEYNKKVKL